MNGTHVLVRGHGSSLVRRGNVMVQVRSGELTSGALSEIEAHVRRLIDAIEGPAGFISLLEQGSVVPAADVRRRQRAFIAEALRGRDVRVAVVIEGSGVGATLMRSVARLLVPGHGAIRVTHEARTAIEWVSRHVPEANAAELYDVLEEARRAARI